MAIVFTFGSIVVPCALVALVVMDATWMDGVGARGEVLKDNLDRVTNIGFNHWTC